MKKRSLALRCGLAAVACAVPAGAQAGTGSQLWSQAGCGGCHTLAAAGSSGAGGPNLDYLRPSAGAVAAQVAAGGGGMPSFSGSLSSSQIDALATWVASVAGSPSAGTSASPVLASASGMSVTAVRKLQAGLKRLGFFHHVVTGFYGPVTTKAVKRFQRSAGLKADGVWGPKSETALKTRLSTSG